MVQFKGSKSEKRIPKWLETIQENSWEAELLLSAVLLFGLIQTPIYLEAWSNYTLAWGNEYVNTLIDGFIDGLELLRIGFIFHIIIRAMWIAQVGFSYVYPKGIKLNNLRFKGRFQAELSGSDSNIKTILNLEKLASMTFSISFMLFSMLLGLIMFASPFILLVWIMESLELNKVLMFVYVFFILFYVLLSIFVFVDFITNGFLRRGRRRAKFYYHISLFYRFMTLSFLYRKTLLTIISNTNGYKRFLITISILITLGIFDSLSNAGRDYHLENYQYNITQEYAQPSNYESKRNADDLTYVTIPSDQIEAEVLLLFVKDQDLFKSGKTRELSDSSSALQVSTDVEPAKFNVKPEILAELIDVFVDTTEVDSLQWYSTVHPNSYDRGFITYLDLSKFSNDLYNLKVIVNLRTAKDSIKRDTLIAFIPFYLNK